MEIQIDGNFYNTLYPIGFIGVSIGCDLPYGWKWCNGKNGTPDLRMKIDNEAFKTQYIQRKE